MSDAVPLPSHPNLEHYRKLARSLQSACRSADPSAVHRWAVEWVEKIAIQRSISLPARALDQRGRGIEGRWRNQLQNNQRSARCLLADAQFFIATELGFASWPKFSRHIESLSLPNSRVANFEAAADAIVSGKITTLRKLLRIDPSLIHARSTREHRSTLLHYVSANGIEDFRQKTPKNILTVAKMLLDAGAEVDAESDAYGGGCTALGLVATSVHPEKAGVQIQLLKLLLDRGARIDQPSPAGNRHSLVSSCVANGQPKAAEFFAALGATLDLESAASLGRLDEVKRYFDDDLAVEPNPDPLQIDKAFLQACGSGHREVAEFLLAHGARLDAQDNECHSGLHYAAYGAQPDTVEFLLERGLPTGLREKSYNATPLDVALWVWQNVPERAARCYLVVALLVRAGAVFDKQHWTDPEEDSPGVLERIRSDPRMGAALRGDHAPQWAPSH